jgi:hypothetical protein
LDGYARGRFEPVPRDRRIGMNRMAEITELRCIAIHCC